MRKVAVLGSTGSIGVSALKVIDRHPDKFKVSALTAYQNADSLAAQVSRYKPDYVGLVDQSAIGRNGASTEWRSGEQCLIEAATLPDVDIVLNAVVGAAGVRATIAALESGKRVALANKESLVMGGELVLEAARRGGGEIVPVDSEHSAILQCLAGSARGSDSYGIRGSYRDVEKVYITASGGPFRGYDRARLENVTIEDALKHPNWSMGRKITVDSATLANKALEVIEAHYLFGLSYDKIEVVVHPQSLIHSMVEFVDCSVVAQLGVPNMELPILYALTHPERVGDSGGCKFNPLRHSELTFEPVDSSNFPALGLGIQAGRCGGIAPVVYNAANEAAVARFLGGSLRFVEIPTVIEGALDKHCHLSAATIEERLQADEAARDFVRSY